MVRLMIKAADRALPQGDFGAAVHANKVEVPQPLADALRAQGIGDAEEMLAFAQTFPTALAALIGWVPADVVQATKRLAGQLGMALHDPAQEPRVMFGARDPSELDRD